MNKDKQAENCVVTAGAVLFIVGLIHHFGWMDGLGIFGFTLLIANRFKGG